MEDWRTVKSARDELRKMGLTDPGFALLNKAPKHRFRRLLPGPTKNRRNKKWLRRKYWYMRREAFDRLVVEAKAAQVEDGMGTDGAVCMRCDGRGTIMGPSVGTVIVCTLCWGSRRTL